MKGFLYGLTVVSVLGFAVVLSLAASDEDAFPGRSATLGVEGTGNLICAFGDSIFGFDTQGPAGDNQILGVEFDGIFFYSTGGNSGVDPNKVYVFDASGNYVSSFDQYRSTGWGWRDLAWDGDTLYGSDDGNVTKFGIDGTDYGDFPGPLSPNRALAYDPATGHFWTASFSSSIYEFDKTGTVIGSPHPNTMAIYGMAWDDVSSDGPWLWVYSQDGAPYPATVSQYDPINYIYTGLSFIAQACSMAGGITFTTDWDTGLGILACAGQTTPDNVVLYEILEISARDVKPVTIDSPGALVAPGVAITPCATVTNSGDSTETFYTKN